MIGVLLVEDHALVRESVQRLLVTSGEFEVTAAPVDPDAIVRMVLAGPPDVLVLDVDLDGHDGIHIASTVRARRRDQRIVFLTMHDEDATLRRALAAGADGFVPKTSGTEELMQALRVVAAGGTYLSPSVTKRALELASGRGGGALAELTDRELEILTALAHGARSSEIAEGLFISVKTVKNHLTNVYAKLGVGSASQAVAEAYHRGLVA